VVGSISNECVHSPLVLVQIFVVGSIDEKAMMMKLLLSMFALVESTSRADTDLTDFESDTKGKCFFLDMYAEW